MYISVFTPTHVLATTGAEKGTEVQNKQTNARTFMGRLLQVLHVEGAKKDSD